MIPANFSHRLIFRGYPCTSHAVALITSGPRFGPYPASSMPIRRAIASLSSVGSRNLQGGNSFPLCRVHVWVKVHATNVRGPGACLLHLPWIVGAVKPQEAEIFGARGGGSRFRPACDADGGDNACDSHGPTRAPLW